MLTAAAVVALIGAVVGLAAWFMPLHNHPVLIAAALAPWLLGGSVVAVVLFALARRWLLVTVAVLVAGTGLALQLPWYMATSGARADTVELRVMTANLYLGSADAVALTSTARQDADILVVQELTPDAASRLSNAGLDEEFPYRALDARSYASGVGLWSRFPIARSDRIPGYQMAMVSADIRVPGVESQTRVVCAHVAGPWPQPIGDWRGDMHLLSGSMDDVARDHRASVIFAGDFNATVSMRPFRDLLRDGYDNAGDQAGAGMLATYPANSWLPPLLGIDHVLVRDATASSARTVRIPGSDHLGLVATVELPRR